LSGVYVRTQKIADFNAEEVLQNEVRQEKGGKGDGGKGEIFIFSNRHAKINLSPFPVALYPIN